MSLKQFLKESEAGYPQAAYLLSGSDVFFLKEAERAIRSGVDESRRDFDVDIFDLDPSSDRTVSLREIIDSLNTFSFFSGRKTVLVQNAQKMKKADLEALARYLSNPSGSSVLFLFYNDSLKADKKKAFSGCKIISLDPTQGELREWLSSFAKKSGISFAGQALDYLITALGGDAGLLVSEIEKFSLTEKKEIEIRDIAELVYGEAGVNTFELTGAITSGNRKRAFQLANELKDGDTGMLLGAINWQISRSSQPLSRMALNYKSLLDADVVNKSSGSSYPLELLILKLMSR